MKLSHNEITSRTNQILWPVSFLSSWGGRGKKCRLCDTLKVRVQSAFWSACTTVTESPGRTGLSEGRSRDVLPHISHSRSMSASAPTLTLNTSPGSQVWSVVSGEVAPISVAGWHLEGQSRPMWSQVNMTSLALWLRRTWRTCKSYS